MRSLGVLAGLFLLVSLQTTSQGQESLGDAARRIRAEKTAKTQSEAPPKTEVVATPASKTDLPTIKADPVKADPVENAKPAETAVVPANLDQLGLTDFENAIQNLLTNERFDELDRIAAEARKKKSRFQGGSWKLRAVYSGLCKELCTSGTSEQMATYIARMKRWIAAKPDSITARIALARAYYIWAWDARGGAFADLVDDDAWKPFNERLQMARKVMDEASQLKEKCPEWYLLMEKIGRGQGWELAELTLLMQTASSAEPLYYYYYQEHALPCSQDGLDRKETPNGLLQRLRTRSAGKTVP